MRAKNYVLYGIISFLTIHLFSVYSRLLFYLNPERATEETFSFLHIDEHTILAFIVALSYSTISSLVIFNSDRKGLVILFGILDSIGVLLYYVTDIPLYFGAIYFALYTGVLIISTLYLRKPDGLLEQTIKLKEKGNTQKTIADKLGISESKVSRILNKENNGYN